MTRFGLKQKVKEVLSHHVALEARELVSRDTARLQPFIAKLLERVDPVSVMSPMVYMDLAYDMFLSIPSDVVRVKWDEPRPKDPAGGGFNRLIDDLSRGRSSITAKHATEVLEVCNRFVGLDQVRGAWGEDVGWHFHVSSSLGMKGRLLYAAVRHFRPRNILEIGTAYGMSALFLMLAGERFGRSPRLWTIEITGAQYGLAKEMLGERFGPAVSTYHGSSAEGIPQACQEASTFDLVFHDGGHSREHYVSDYESMTESLAEGALLIVDDIRWWDHTYFSKDPGCYQGWRHIVSNRKIRRAVEVNGTVGLALIGP